MKQDRDRGVGCSAWLGRVAEGIYQLEVCGERLVVDVRITMQGQWPEKREVLMAHPLSGPPRFPWTVSELMEWGGVFKRPNTDSAKNLGITKTAN